MNAIARFVALPIVSAGIIAGAGLGMAGMANAATQAQGPGHSYSPSTYAAPAATPAPGWRNHHGARHIAELQRQAHRHTGR